MSKIISFVLLFTITANIYSQDISGSWAGSINIQGAKLRITFNISKTGSTYESSMDSPDQGAYGIPTTSTKYLDNNLVIEAESMALHYQGVLESDSINGTFKQGGVSLPLTLRRSEKVELSRPQTPIEPFPYISEDVSIIDESNNHTISGTLTLPNSKGVFPAVILIAGSGPNDRDETLFAHKPFLVISDYLTRNGFAVLRYDKRGVGNSTGSFINATINDFADDAALAVDYLKQRGEIESSKIGLAGHSEGGIVASIVAADNSDINFMILMASPGIKGIDIVLDQNEFSMTYQSFQRDVIEEIQSKNKRLFESLIKWNGTRNDSLTLRQELSALWSVLPESIITNIDKDLYLSSQYNTMITPGYRSFLLSDPVLYLQKVRCPVFAINGKLDSQVSADKNLHIIKESLMKSGNTNVEIKVYDKLNHLFQESTTGLIDEYAIIEQTMSPKVLLDITNWLKKHTD